MYLGLLIALIYFVIIIFDVKKYWDSERIALRRDTRIIVESSKRKILARLLFSLSLSLLLTLPRSM